MQTLFSDPRHSINVLNYNSEDYPAKSFSPKEQSKNTVDTWTRSAQNSTGTILVTVNGTEIHQQVKRNGTTFKEDPKSVIQALLNQNGILPEALIEYIVSYANLDGFMGMLQLSLREAIKEQNPDSLGELDLTSHYEFVTNSENKTVTYTECVDVCCQDRREKIMTLQCSSVISVEDGIPGHKVDDSKSGLTIHKTCDVDQLFGSGKSLITRILNRLREFLSNLLSRTSQDQCRSRFQL